MIWCYISILSCLTSPYHFDEKIFDLHYYKTFAYFLPAVVTGVKKYHPVHNYEK